MKKKHNLTSDKFPQHPAVPAGGNDDGNGVVDGDDDKVTNIV